MEQIMVQVIGTLLGVLIAAGFPNLGPTSPQGRAVTV